MIPVILSGGSGSRLWPLSRQLFPKQFHALVDKKTMLQETLSRGNSSNKTPIIVCNKEHRYLVAEQMKDMGIEPCNILLEPLGRNTAPAIAIASLHALTMDEDAILLVMPADHHIPDIKAFNATIEVGKKEALAGNIVTLGITPAAPDTGYGYIKAKSDGKLDNLSVYPVDSFTEKPDKETARQYLDSGKYLWNSGIFIFKASVLLDEMKQHEAEVLEASIKAYGSIDVQGEFLHLGKDFESIKSISIDYAVMEKSSKLVVVRTDMAWSDMGSWDSIYDHAAKDSQSNCIIGDVLVEGSNNCYIRSGKRLIAAVGMEDTIIVETDNAILVANKNKAQDVKQIVEILKSDKREEW